MSNRCYLNYSDPNLTYYVLMNWGPPCLEWTVFIVTISIYCVIFVVGFLGNACTCIVILRNKPLHTATNYYLFSLAVSDLLSLLLGLPQEVYISITTLYPYPFSEAICKIRTYASEMTTYASILTISAFAFERWFAIRHPLRIRVIAQLSRCFRIIFLVWLLASLGAAPLLYYVGIFRLMLPHGYLDKKNISEDSVTVPRTEICALDPLDMRTQSILFNLSFWVFFALPIVIMILLCTHICILITRTRDVEGERPPPDRLVQGQGHGYRKITLGKHDAKFKSSRRTVVTVLVAVVVAFIICWLPFHIQRQMITFVTNWNDLVVQNIFNVVYFISGYFYYANSAINPILYNALNRRFRTAFLKTICGMKVDRKASLYQSLANNASTVRTSTFNGSRTRRYSTSTVGLNIKYSRGLSTASTTPYYSPNLSVRHNSIIEIGNIHRTRQSRSIAGDIPEEVVETLRSKHRNSREVTFPCKLLDRRRTLGRKLGLSK